MPCLSWDLFGNESCDQYMGIGTPTRPRHLADEARVEHVLGPWMQGTIGNHHVADLQRGLHMGVAREAQLLFDLIGDAPAVHIVQVKVERLVAAQDRQADPPGNHMVIVCTCLD